MIDTDNDTQTGEAAEAAADTGEPRQEELPFAIVEGVAVTELPPSAIGSSYQSDQASPARPVTAVAKRSMSWLPRKGDMSASP